MDPSIFFYLSSSDEENNERVVRKQLRDKSNPLALSNNAFIQRFRLSKEAFNYVLNNININCQDTKAVPAVLQLAACLSLLASGGYQHAIGNDYLIGMCQSTVSKLTGNVLEEIEAKLCPKHIKFEPDDSRRCKEWFVENYQIPGVVGCIDGTHIGLQKPTVNEHMYFNRKGFHSINAMLICDHTTKILAINCQYGGAAHDSFIWKHSNERMVMEHRFLHNRSDNAWLLGNIINSQQQSPPNELTILNETNHSQNNIYENDKTTPTFNKTGLPNINDNNLQQQTSIINIQQHNSHISTTQENPSTVQTHRAYNNSSNSETKENREYDMNSITTMLSVDDPTTSGTNHHKNKTSSNEYQQIFREALQPYNEGWEIIYTDGSKSDTSTTFAVTNTLGATITVGALPTYCSAFTAEVAALHEEVLYASR
ncbi:uncharacterized protein LOC129250617 [Anastrepha obliqua]|uniref:uncharacterized protein LOC129250617 n=2 Tax=Anastrepha obliqua TaxID=95512 RepID=UPI002409D452|nr:uncharacterized protein LOC129250617 [Anastrepha obliqua]